MARSYRELLVWQKAKSLAVDLYRETENFPKSETYGLSSQLRRAAVSVVSNIAEGQGRDHTKEFLNHLSMARGSPLRVEKTMTKPQKVPRSTQYFSTVFPSGHSIMSDFMRIANVS